MDSDNAVLKKVLIGLGAGLSLIILLLLAVPYLINGNGYKTEIITAISEATGRPAAIDGAITPRALPYPAVRIEGVRVGNWGEGSDQPMLRLGAVEGELSVWSLLTGSVRFQHLTLEQPQIILEQTAAGANWDFVQPARRAESTEPSLASPSSVGSALPTVEDQSGLAQAVERSLQHRSGVLSDLRTLTITGGSLRFDRFGRRFEASDITAEVTLQGLRGPIKAEASFGYRRATTTIPLGLTMAWGGVVDSGASPVSLRLSVQGSDAVAGFSGFVADSASGRSLSGELRASAKDSADLAQRVGLAGAPTTGALGVFAKVQTNAARTSIDDLTIDLGESHLQGSLLWDRSQQPGQLTGRLSLGSLNLDRWQEALHKAASAAEPETSPSTPTAALETAPEAAQAQAQVAQAEDPAPFVLPISGAYRGTLDVRVGALTWRGMVLQQGHLAVSLDDKGAAVDELTIQLPGSASIGVVGRLTPAPEADGGAAFDLSVQAQSDDFRSLVGWLGGDVAAVPGGRLNRFHAAATIGGVLREIAIRDVDVVFDTSSVRGAATVRPPLRNGQRWAMGLTVAGGTLNLDAYFPPGKPKPETRTPAPAPAPTQTETPPQDRLEMAATTAPAAVAPAASPLREGLDWLVGWDANLRLSLDSLLWHGVNYKGLSAEATLVAETLSIHSASVQDAAGGAATLSGAVQVGAAPELRDVRYNLHSATPQRTLRAFGIQSSDGLGNAEPLTLEGTLSGPLDGEQALTMGIMARLGEQNTLGVRGTVLHPLQAWTLDGAVTAQAPEAARVARLWDDGALNGRSLGALAFHADLHAGGGKAALTDLSLKVGPDQGTGSVSVDWISGARPAIQADLHSERLDFNRTLPAAPAKGKSKKAASLDQHRWVAANDGGDVLSDAPGLLQLAALPAGRWSTEPFDRSAWRQVDADVTLKAGFLGLAGVEIDNADVVASLRDGVLTLSRLQGGLYGGPMTGSGSFNVQGDLPTAALTLSAEQMQLARLLKALSGSAGAVGQGKAQIALTARGISEASLINSLGGEGSVAFTDVVPQKGAGNSALVAPILALNQFASMAHQKEASAAQIQATFAIQNGIVSVKNSEVSSALYKGHLRGLVNLPLWTLDLNGEASLSETLVSSFLQQKLKLPTSLPIALSGPIDAPNIRVMTGAIPPGGALPPSERAKQVVPGLLNGMLGGSQPSSSDQQPAVKPEKAGRDLLKGILFGR